MQELTKHTAVDKYSQVSDEAKHSRHGLLWTIGLMVMCMSAWSAKT